MFRILVVTAVVTISKEMSNGFMRLRKNLPEVMKQFFFSTPSTRNLLIEMDFDDNKLWESNLNVSTKNLFILIYNIITVSLCSQTLASLKCPVIRHSAGY